MIILGQINFSEEQRLFGYWKKKNKELKRGELLEAANKNFQGSGLPSDGLICAERGFRKSRTDDAVFGPIGGGGKPENINQLINKKAEILGGETGELSQNFRLDPEAIKKRNQLSHVKVKGGRSWRYDHPSSDIDRRNGFGEAYDVRKEYYEPKGKKVKEKLVKNIKKKGKIKNLKNLKKLI